MGDLTPQLKLPLYQSTASWWGKTNPFSYPLTTAWTYGKNEAGWVLSGPREVPEGQEGTCPAVLPWGEGKWH